MKLLFNPIFHLKTLRSYVTYEVYTPKPHWQPSHRPVGCATTGLESTVAAPPKKAKIQLAGANKILLKTYDGQKKD